MKLHVKWNESMGNKHFFWFQDTQLYQTKDAVIIYIHIHIFMYIYINVLSMCSKMWHVLYRWIFYWLLMCNILPAPYLYVYIHKSQVLWSLWNVKKFFQSLNRLFIELSPLYTVWEISSGCVWDHICNVFIFCSCW